MQPSTIKTYWVVIGLIAIGVSYIVFLVGHTVASDNYAAAEWDKYLSHKYPILSAVTERRPLSSDEFEKIDALQPVVQSELKPKLKEFRKEYDQQHFGGVVLKWLGFNTALNLLVFALYSVVISRNAAR